MEHASGIQSHSTSILSQWLPEDLWVSTFSSHQKTSKYQQFTLGQKIPQHFSYHSCLLMQRIYWTSINLDQKMKTNIFFYDAVWFHSYTKIQNLVYSCFFLRSEICMNPQPTLSTFLAEQFILFVSLSHLKNYVLCWDLKIEMWIFSLMKTTFHVIL